MKPTAHVAAATTHHTPGSATLERVYHEHADLVWRLLRRLGVLDTHREDVFHEVFLAVHHRLADHDARTILPAWMSALTREVALHHRRDHAKHLRVASPGPLATHDGSQREPASDSAGERMPQRARVLAWSRLQTAIQTDALHAELAGSEQLPVGRRLPWSVVLLAAATIAALVAACPG